MAEIWKSIVGAEGFYEVSNLGRVRSLDKQVGHRWGGVATKRGKVLKPMLDKDGYQFVGIRIAGKTKSYKVHRLVAEHFLHNSGFFEVNHKDFVKTNNNSENLEWCSRRNNQQHASSGGRFSAASNPKRAKKLTPEIVARIRDARKSGLTFSAIANQFGVSTSTALKISRGDIWGENCSCGVEHDRDTNAALNIRARGLASLVVGASA